MLTDQEGRSVFAKGQVATSYLLNASSPWSRKAHISTFFVHERVVFREERIALTCLSPIKKAKQPPPSFPSAPSARSFVRALVPACSYAPAPVLHPRVFGSPSAHDSRLCFFVRTSALAPNPRVFGSSRPRLAYGSFGSPQYPTFYRVPAPFRTLAISAPSSQLSFPLLRSLAPVFSARPSIYPGPVFRARSLGASCMPPAASATQFLVLSSFFGVFSTCHPLFPGNYLADSRGKFGGHCHIPN